MSAMSAKPAYFNPLPRKEGDPAGANTILANSIFQSTPS